MDIKKTALYEIHKKLKAKIIDFAGVYLPVFYSSIQEEHLAVRNNIGLFDVSHMGNLILKFNKKEEAVNFLNYLLPNDFSKIYPGKCIYSTMLNHEGTVIDDIIVMSLTDTEYHIIVNASNIKKDYEWISSVIKDKNIIIDNRSEYYSIMAVQGPGSMRFLENEFNFPVSKLKTFELSISEYNSKELLISRTGYTGENGYECILDNDSGVKLFEELLEKGKKYGLKPCGLGSRDTLRIEAGLPLYGHELDDKHSPLQTNMKWSVKLNKPLDFIGKKAMIDGMNDRFFDVLIGFEVIGRSIPRQSMNIISVDNKTVGYVTSGTYSISLKKNIGIAYIKPDQIARDLKIEIRGRLEDIKLIDLPFYKRI
jgi:aminomethyltransferase